MMSRSGFSFWFLALAILPFMGLAQPHNPTPPMSWRLQEINQDIPLLQLDTGISELIQAWEARMEHAPMLQGFSVEASHEFARNAKRLPLPDGSATWRMEVASEGAHKLGLVLSSFEPEEGDTLYIYVPDRSHLLTYTQKDARNHGLLSATPLPSHRLIIEYKSSNPTPPQLVIDELIYLLSEDVLEKTGLKNSGSCNVNINCPEGAMWQKQKRGVVRILLRSGSTWFNCSGSLVNNTLEDGTPYLLTADHCGASASAADLLVWQFYFNNEFETCVSSGVLPNNMMLTGSTLVAKGPLQGGTDFKLLLLQDEIPLDWNPYFNGWSRFPMAGENGAGIHHPSGDAKKISTYTQAPTTATFTGGMSGSFWRLTWAQTESGHGVTEGGSSGSPLFDSDGLIIGTLTGGSASCTNTHLPDFYGKFDRHWQANGQLAERQLQPWLDPNNQSPLRLYGYDPNAITNFVIAWVEPASSGTVSGAGYFAENEPVQLSAIPNEGFKFVNWTDTLDNPLSDELTYTFVMPDEEITLRANFAEIQPHVNEQDTLRSVMLIPNPAQEQVQLRLVNFQGTAQVVLFNSLGQRMRSWNIQTDLTSEAFPLHLAGLPNGIYFLHIVQENNFMLRKLIIGR